MAEPNIKLELNSEPSLITHDDVDPTPSSSPELTYDPLWKRHQDDTLPQLVAIEEQSLAIALPQLLELKSWLLKYSDIIPSVVKKIEMIGEWISCPLLVSSS